MIKLRLGPSYTRSFTGKEKFAKRLVQLMNDDSVPRALGDSIWTAGQWLIHFDNVDEATLSNAQFTSRDEVTTIGKMLEMTSDVSVLRTISHSGRKENKDER